jgi:hypothetical protein
LTETRPDELILGGTLDVRAKFTDPAGLGITPIESRISVKAPTGDIYTVSGGDLLPVTSPTTISGMYYFVYRPEVIGWYEYESWGKDANGNERVETNGFEIKDRLYP